MDARREELQEQRKRLYAKLIARRVGLSVALKLPLVGLGNLALPEPMIPTGIEFQAHEIRLPDGSVSNDFFPDIENGQGFELPKGIVSFDFFDANTAFSVDMVAGIGIRLHFDQDMNLSGIGVAAGVSASNVGKLIGHTFNLPAKTNISGSVSTDIRDL